MSPAMRKQLSNKAVVTYGCNMTAFFTTAYISSIDSGNMARIAYGQFFATRGLPNLILIDEGTPLGNDAKKFMDAGKLVPDELMVGLVMEEATPNLDEGKSLLLDGFPRTVTQAKELEKTVHVDLVINLDIPTETIVERIADRWIHPASGRVYSYSYKPPKVQGKDDETGEPLVQRPDDEPEKVRARLGLYDAATFPLVDFYESNGVLKSFPGTQSDVIYPEVKIWLDAQFDSPIASQA